ncbi:hypothetical protein AVEN_178258-1 [Araneus ventricosus]|uniref:Uncharacterized protein n=1 Tax=Araneus ventricosus TaxID=182803 RepID=A0A4Y2LDB7_ARAVE|nr:hypothetical protein AVEN_178258-1 [Araneus ventricosus]
MKTKTTPGLTSPNTPAGGCLEPPYDLMCNRLIYTVSSMESDFEHGTLRLKSRQLTTWPPRPSSRLDSSHWGHLKYLDEELPYKQAGSHFPGGYNIGVRLNYLHADDMSDMCLRGRRMCRS